MKGKLGSLRYCLYWLVLWDFDAKKNETFGYIMICYVPLWASVCLEFVVLILIWIGHFFLASWLEKSIFGFHSLFFYFRISSFSWIFLLRFCTLFLTFCFHHREDNVYLIFNRNSLLIKLIIICDGG